MRTYLFLALLAMPTACGKKKSTTEDQTTEGSQSGTAAVVAEPAPAMKGVKAALGGKGGPFTPSSKGFSFENYVNEGDVENLTPVELERMFGDQVCGDREGTTCILTPPAKKWMEETNKAMNGGHCEGLAALALLFELGKADPKDFGAPTAFELKLAGNTKLQHEVALWWSTQGIAPMSSAEIHTMTPNEIADTLADAFTTNKESYTLGIYMPDGSLGHATTPYAIVDKGDGKWWIMHYDNNNPGEERHIDLDRTANTWSYFTASDPKEPGSTYTGDATTKNLTIAPTSVRTGKLVCPFCGDVDAPDEDSSKGSRQIIMDGGADLLVTDDSGKRTGHANGKLVNEIAGAQVVEVKNGGHASEHEPIYNVPNGHALTLTLDGSTLKAKDATDVSLIGPGYTMGVYGVMLSPGEKDEIHFSGDWKDVSYKTDQDETPEIEIGVETAGPDYEFDIHGSAETGGQKIDLSLDVKAGTISVQSSSKDGTGTYEVEVHRIDKGGDQVFTHKGVASHGNDKFVFHYADWKGNGQPMKAGVDKGGDGSIDETEDLNDDE